MSPDRIPESQDDFDEILLKQYPDLARARALFIDLFTDNSPLVNLGYSSRQMQRAIPVLKLLEGEGEVMTHLPGKPYLSFNNPINSDAEALQVYYLPDKKGYLLSAFNEGGSADPDQSQQERALRFLFWNPSVEIFPDLPEQVVQIGLFNPKSDTNDLDYLVRQLYDENYTEAPLGMRQKNPINRVIKVVGAAGTYEAAWVDEQTKLEFVVIADAPEDAGLEPAHARFRKLASITDSTGKMLPIGKKPGISSDHVKEILTKKNQKTLPNSLAAQGSEA